MVFDVLSVDGERVASQPHSERRGILEDLQLDGWYWRTPEAFEHGEALWDAVCAHELEGVVARPLRSRYVPGERVWVKVKKPRLPAPGDGPQSGRRARVRDRIPGACGQRARGEGS
jgi:bifunctional non-homologous end joining protein LigD